MTELSTGTRARLRVLVTGVVEGEAELRDELEPHLDVEFGGGRGLAGLAALRERRPAVVLHGIDTDVALEPGRVGAEVRALREHTDAPVVLLVPDASPELLEEALAADVADILVLPQMLDTVVFAVRKAGQVGRGTAGRESGDGRGRVLTVFSPKGGTGKTVLATNLAATVARDGKRVLLVDLDLQFGDAGMMLGLMPAKTVSDLVSAPGELDEEKLAGYTARHPSGMELLAAPMRPEEAEAVTEAKVTQILDVARSAYDVVVVDTSPFFYGPLFATLEPTDQLLVLCGVDAPTMKNVRLGLQTLELLSFPPDRIGVVLNRVGPHADVSRGEVEQVLERRVSFELPEDGGVLAAVNRGMPTTLLDESSPFSAAVRAVAHALVPGAGTEPAGARAESIRRRLLGRIS